MCSLSLADLCSPQSVESVTGEISDDAITCIWEGCLPNELACDIMAHLNDDSVAQVVGRFVSKTFKATIGVTAEPTNDGMMRQWAVKAGHFCMKAVATGNVGLVRWARKNGCPWDEDTCSEAAAGGHLITLQWLRENGCPWDAQTCTPAAAGGHLRTLQWLSENGCPRDEYTCSGAAAGGHIRTLQ